MSRPDSESNSNRHHSRFDPELSPKRYRKDVKQKRDKTKCSSNVGHRPDDHHEPPKRQADPTTQADRSSGQMKPRERGWWKDIKNKHSEKEEISQGRNHAEEKSQAKPNDSTYQRRDGFSERKETQPTSRKRPAFRENKIPMDLGDVNLAATVAVKSSQFDHPPERKERKERKQEKRSNPFYMDRAEHTTRIKLLRDGVPSRERQRGNGNSRGRENFNGRKGYGYLPIKTQIEKWKPDLYQDVNKDPVLQNEDDQIAKLEALLTS